jgi:hypothetical protein
MTMKNIFGWLTMLILLMTACDLEQLPESTTSKVAVFSTEKGLELYANSFYSILPTANNIIRSDEMSDYAARTQVPDLLREAGFGPLQSSGWDWSALRNINYFIANCNHPAVSPEATRHYIGLAKFFRAWFYFDKVKRFGDVPWIGKPMEVTDPDLYKVRDPRMLVMDSVLNDLNYATANIRTVNDNSRSLITKYVAHALKSRICLFEGTYRKYHPELELQSTANQWLSEAATAASTVMAEGGFGLNETGGAGKSYRQLFINKTPVTSEIVLAAVCDPTLSIYNDANWWWTSATYGPRVSFTRTFVNTYLKTDGTSFTSTAGYETMPFTQEVKGRDARLQQSIRMSSYTRTNAGAVEAAPPVFSYTYTGYQPIKWCLDDTFYDGGSRNDNSISIIRYAEVLLNFAEAKAELGTLTDEDWTKTAGALRKRAGITGGLSAKPGVADPYLKANYFPEISDAVILELRRERSIELALEGFRFYDLVRWKHGELLEKPWNGFYVPALNVPMDLNEDGKMDVLFYKGTAPAPIAGVTFVNVSETISGGVNPQRLSNDTSGEITWLKNIPRKWEDKKYLFPIPENDRLANPALGQNPGW